MFQLIFLFFSKCTTKKNVNLVVDNLDDIKDFKKLLRTKTNVLVCFYNDYKGSQNVIKLFKEVAGNIKGEGTMVLLDCSGYVKSQKLKLIATKSFFLGLQKKCAKS